MEEASEISAFDDITEEEILSLCLFSSLSGDGAWNAISAGIALDIAFGRSKNLPQVEQ